MAHMELDTHMHVSYPVPIASTQVLFSPWKQVIFQKTGA